MTLVGWVVTQDCLLLLVENKLLSLIISVEVLDNKVSTVSSEYSVHWEHVDDREWSIDEKSELFVESLDLLLELINVDKLPLLAEAVVSAVNLDFIGLLVSTTDDIEVLVVVGRYESVSFHLPELVSVRVDSRDLDSSLATVTLKVKSVVGISETSNGLGLTVELELLLLLTV